MKISLSDSFSYSKLLKFTFPSIIMMVFTSVYSVVDGFFVSNIVGKTAFAAVNLIFPFIMVLGGMGAMFGVGGSALVAKTIGEGETQKARRYFTMMIYVMLVVGVVFTVLGIVFMRPVSYLFGATEEMIDECVIYGRTVLIFNTAMLAQYTFQSYLIVAEKPKLGLFVTVLAGVTNMVLDFLFMSVFELGISGAALATGLSQCVGGIIPAIWFLSKRNKSALRFAKTKIEIKPMLKACTNGASEMLSSVSGSVTGILYNLQLIKYAGEDGVAAYGVVMYAAYVFIAIFMGFCTGSSPIMGYHFGAQNRKEMKNLFKKSVIILGTGGALLTVAGVLLARPIALFFVSYDEALLELTVRAFSICALPFVIMSINMYTSSLFTALNNGGVSAAISFLRALIFPVISIIVLPVFFELDGVWFSLVGSEILSFIVSIVFLSAYRKRYEYC